MQTSRTQDLTSGSITQSMLNLAYPLILGNLLQQGYNIADTFIIGKTLGAKALAAVGSSYTLMVFITSIFIGLCMGCSALFSMRYGAKDYESLRRTQAASLLITGSSTLIIFAFSCYYIQDIITLMQTPQELQDMTYDYLKIIFMGIWFVYLYNYYAYLLRALGNSLTPLIYLAISVVLNIMLDIMVYCKTSLRNRRSCGCDHHFPSSFGHWLMLLLLEKGSRNQTLQKGFQGQQAAHETSLLIRLTDLRTAICHEFWNPHGSRSGQQLRYSRHGRFYSCRKD